MTNRLSAPPRSRSGYSYSLSARAALALILVTAAACGGGGGSGSPNPPLLTVSVAIAPFTASVQVGGGTAQFRATVSSATDSAVTWAVNDTVGGGTAQGSIDANGLYTAPAAVPTASNSVTITAISTADPHKAATASVTLLPLPAAISLAPASVTLTAGKAQQFDVVPTVVSAIQWSVNGVSGGNTSVGTIGATGIYVAPATLTAGSSTIVTVGAALASQPATTASAAVTLYQPAVIAVSTLPASACIHGGASVAISAVVGNDPQSQGVNWTLRPIGPTCTATQCGLLTNLLPHSATFTAASPLGVAGTVNVVAASVADPSKSATTMLTVEPTTGSVGLVPSHAELTLGQIRSFQATAFGLCDSAVKWAVDGVVGGNAASGTIDAVGNYQTPSVAGIHIVTAYSVETRAATGSATVAVTDLAAVATYHADGARTGQNTREYGLTPANVKSGIFGRLSRCMVDGDVYAEPLYLAHLPVAGGVHNIVYVATEHDSVYAFDADDGLCTAYWVKSLIANGAPIPAGIAGETTNLREVGITGTPVIDVVNQTLFVVAATAQGSTFFQRLHALDLASGAERTNSPVDITGSATISFDSLRQNQRSALLLQQGIIYVAWASHDDIQPYAGLLMGYDATSLSRVSIYDTTAHGLEGGIWMSGSGPAVDAAGNLFLASGNGTFDDTTQSVPPLAPNDDLADSVIRLSTVGGLSVSGFFTPAIQSFFSAQDLDLGSGGVIVLPDSAGSASHPHLLMVGDKASTLYLLDRDNLGGYVALGPDRVIQSLNLAGSVVASPGIISTPAWWQGNVYVSAATGTLQMYRLTNAQLSVAPVSQSAEVQGRMGATPMVSSLGGSNGIVWVLDNEASGTVNGSATGAAILRAYDATNVASLLFGSNAASADQCGDAVKFTVPTVANGKVYVGGQGQLTVYGSD